MLITSTVFVKYCNVEGKTIIVLLRLSESVKNNY